MNYYNIKWMGIKGFVSVVGIYLKIAVLYTATLASINYSLISNIYSLTPFLLAISFYFLYKEVLSSIHVIGIVTIITGIVLTGVGQSSTSSSDESLSVIVPIMIAVVYSII